MIKMHKKYMKGQSSRGILKRIMRGRRKVSVHKKSAAWGLEAAPLYN
jgi:hypothetical protein